MICSFFPKILLLSSSHLCFISSHPLLILLVSICILTISKNSTSCLFQLEQQLRSAEKGYDPPNTWRNSGKFEHTHVGHISYPTLTPSPNLCYIAFHDEEWGVPVHDDKETFLEFDPRAVSKLSEKKIAPPGSPASPLLSLSELKIRAIIENARQICKVIDEFGSFDKYIGSFVNHMPIVGQFRYPRQVPVKSSKSEVISEDLIRRGFRSAGPTVACSFMQVAGLTNDHLMSWHNRSGIEDDDEAN